MADSGGDTQEAMRGLCSASRRRRRSAYRRWSASDLGLRTCWTGGRGRVGGGGWREEEYGRGGEGWPGMRKMAGKVGVPATPAAAASARSIYS
jgi:hypothetical protein